MNNYISNMLRAVRVAILPLLALALVACDDRRESPSQNEGEGAALRVAAELAQAMSSRAYQESGAVADGRYYLTYPSTSGSRLVATVEFDKEETPGLGIVTAPNGSELSWNMVQNVATPTFYLDNVDPALDANSGADPLTVTFAEDNNPYVAAIFDDEEGTNDLLWGTQIAARDDKFIKFDLHHYMSRVRVEITIDSEFAIDESDVALDDAVVEISSLVLVPESYNRLDGSLSLGSDPEYEDLVLVNKEADEELDWKDVVQDDGNEFRKVYTTKDFVLPPQRLLENEERPRLYITLSNGKIYSGILPHAMDVFPKNENKYPVTLQFLKEYVLTLRTLITQNPPELEFMPVTVVEWVDKGEFTIEGHQAGIYTVDEFYDLVAGYAANDESKLARYGYKSSNNWVFNFWHDVELELSKIERKMQVTDGKPDFSFKFNNYTNRVKNGTTTESLSGSAGERRLYEIVTGKTTQP